MRRAQAKKMRALGRERGMSVMSSTDCSIGERRRSPKCRLFMLKVCFPDGSMTSDMSGMNSSFDTSHAVNLLESGDLSASQEQLNSTTSQVRSLLSGLNDEPPIS